MIVNVRTYTMVPRKLNGYVELFEKLGLPVMKKHGFELLGFYTSQIGALNQAVHIWKYESLADLEKKRAARDADPDWAKFLSQTEGYVLLQEDKIMKPASFSPKQ